jgi:hypothetical protein
MMHASQSAGGEGGPMSLGFEGGPYDGMDVNHALGHEPARIVPVTGDVGRRVFVLLPPRASWDALLRGERAATEPPEIYERVFEPDGSHFVATAQEAFNQAQLEARLKLHARGSTALGALSWRDRDAVLKAAAALQTSDPASWPAEVVSQHRPDEPLYVLRVPPEMLVLIEALEHGGIEVIDIMREETMRLWVEHSRAGSQAG